MRSPPASPSSSSLPKNLTNPFPASISVLVIIVPYFKSGRFHAIPLLLMAPPCIHTSAHRCFHHPFPSSLPQTIEMGVPYIVPQCSPLLFNFRPSLGLHRVLRHNSVQRRPLLIARRRANVEGASQEELKFVEPLSSGDLEGEIIPRETNLGSAVARERLLLSKSYNQWDSITGQLAGSATIAFLLLQVPQIVLNAQNLISGNRIALFAVPWMGQLTGLMGNLSLLSYFAKKRENGAIVVQAVGVISTFVVLLQLSMAGSMPSTALVATATAVGLGLLFNFLNYKNLLSVDVWTIWEDAITIGGISVLPQVMWSTFDPFLPPSVLPGITAAVIAISLVVLKHMKKLPSNAAALLGAVSSWTATFLFMWAPVAQMWANYMNPQNIQGLSVFTVLLAMAGNGLLLPRALFTRDVMWFTGASWGTLLQGWGILATMYINKCIGDAVFWGATSTLAVWLGIILWKDSKAYSLHSPLYPLVELVSNRTFAPNKMQ